MSPVAVLHRFASAHTLFSSSSDLHRRHVFASHPIASSSRLSTPPSTSTSRSLKPRSTSATPPPMVEPHAVAAGFTTSAVCTEIQPLTAPPTPELSPARPPAGPLDDSILSSHSSLRKPLAVCPGSVNRDGIFTPESSCYSGGSGDVNSCCGSSDCSEEHPPLYRGPLSIHLRDLLQRIDLDGCDADGENAFFLADLSEVYRQHLRWIRALPRIVPFYAVKCNPDPYVLRLLAAMGAGFDCASNGEIQSVLDLGISPQRIIYANPCKASSFVRNAAAQGVGLTTFDNADELVKVKRFHPKCKLVVRILTDDSKSVCQLGLKFGAPLDSVPMLLAKARELDLDVVGVSFHVGSGCYDPNAYRDAIERARRAFDMGRKEGYVFDFLDVGGGYGPDNFEMIADVLGPAIDDIFPDRDFAPGGRLVQGKPHGLRIISEPGRYYVQRAFVLAANIIARRDGRSQAKEERDGDEAATSTPAEAGAAAAAEDKPEVMYYQNDGVYGAFNCILYDHQVVHPKVLTLGRRYVYRPDLEAPGIDVSRDDEGSALSDADKEARKLQACSVWGPTCDSIDLVKPVAHLPSGLEVGDWLVYEGLGAYTIAASSGCFNGMKKSTVQRYISGEGDEAKEVERLILSSF